MIKICTPYYSEYNQVMDSLPDCLNNGIEFDFEAARGPYIAQSRNALINKESSQDIWQDVGRKYSHFLFVDSDIGFNSGHVNGLMELKEPVSCCPYLRHNSENEYQVGLFSEPGLIKERFTTKDKGIQRVDWCGGGFILVRSDVFTKIPYPWFRYGLFEKDGKAEIIGEDFCFAMALNNANINIWCNLDMPVYHRNRKADYET